MAPVPIDTCWFWGAPTAGSVAVPTIRKRVTVVNVP